MLGRFLSARFIPRSTDTGLLILRIGTGLILFMRHGWQKAVRMSLTYPQFPDPLHIGHNTSWILAMLSDVVFSLLLVLGVGTRWLALYSFVNIFVAWALVEHFPFVGRSPAADHGELMLLYLSALLVLMVSGGGRYSIDAMVSSPDSDAPSRPLRA